MHTLASLAPARSRCRRPRLCCINTFVLYALYVHARVCVVCASPYHRRTLVLHALYAHTRGVCARSLPRMRLFALCARFLSGEETVVPCMLPCRASPLLDAQKATGWMDPRTKLITTPLGQGGAAACVQARIYLSLCPEMHGPFGYYCFYSNGSYFHGQSVTR